MVVTHAKERPVIQLPVMKNPVQVREKSVAQWPVQLIWYNCLKTNVTG